MLKDVLKEIKNPTIVIKYIDNQLRVVPKQVPLKFFRPSSIVGECPVSMWYGMRHIKWSNPELAGGVSPQLARIFQLGTDIHTEIQHWLGKAGVLWGLWKCSKCGELYSDEFSFIPKGKCSCGKYSWVYEEITMVDKGYNIVGHTDGIIKKDDKTYLLEIKSMNSFKYARLKEPDAIHVKQASVYAWLMKQAHNIDIDKIVLLYYSKNDSVLGEYVIDIDWSVVKNVKDVMNEVNNGLKTGKRPKRICQAPIVAKAVKCPFRDVCFDKVKEIKMEE